MEKYEVLFDAVCPTLDEARIEQWKPADFDIFLSLLSEYHRTRRGQWQQEEREAKKGKKQKGEATAEAEAEHHHHHHHTEGAPCGQDACGGASHHTAHGPSSSFSFLPSQESVAVVDRQLVKIKHYLSRAVPYGSLDEPTRVEDGQKKGNKTSPTTTATTAGAVVAPPVFAVDAFLWEEEDVVELVQEGKLPREYCKACGSTQIGLTDFISHSFSRDQMVYISCFLLPFLNEQSRTLYQRPVQTMAEVGARFGGLLWASLEAKKVNHGDGDGDGDGAAAAGLPFLQRVIGIELDPKMVELERTVLKRFFTPSRPGGADPLPCACDLIESDCFQGEGAAALRAADVLVLHNVFEYFVKSPAEHLRCWQTLRQLACRPGQLLVCAPSLEETFSLFDETTLQGLAADTNNDATAPGRKRGRSGSNSKKDASSSLHPLAAAWLTSYVEPVDVAALQEVFVSFRTGHMACGGGGGDGGCCGDEGCCGGAEGEEADTQSFVGELKELVANISVYRVI